VLRGLALPAIVGNTDEWIRVPPPIPAAMPEADRPARRKLQELCRWTEQKLDLESLAWLDQLRTKFQLRFRPSALPADDLLIVHANPLDLLGLIFPSPERQDELYGKVRQSDAELVPLLGDVPENAIAFGHLHIPGVRHWRDKMLVNVSSVSLPGDGDRRAKYAILTWTPKSGWQAETIRIEYSNRDEIDAFRSQRPPGWQERAEQLESLGYNPQVV